MTRRTASGSIAFLTLGMMLLASAAFAQGEGRLGIEYGVGAGQTYGGLGVNGETTSLTDQLVYTAGLGIFGDLGWQVGARYYFQPPVAAQGGNRGWRVTLSLGNRLATDDDNWGTESGLMGSLGYRWHRWDADLDLPIGLISVGYRFTP